MTSRLSQIAEFLTSFGTAFRFLNSNNPRNVSRVLKVVDFQCVLFIQFKVVAFWSPHRWMISTDKCFRPGFPFGRFRLPEVPFPGLLNARLRRTGASIAYLRGSGDMPSVQCGWWFREICIFRQHHFPVPSASKICDVWLIRYAMYWCLPFDIAFGKPLADGFLMVSKTHGQCEVVWSTRRPAVVSDDESFQTPCSADWRHSLRTR